MVFCCLAATWAILEGRAASLCCERIQLMVLLSHPFQGIPCTVPCPHLQALVLGSAGGCSVPMARISSGLGVGVRWSCSQGCLQAAAPSSCVLFVLRGELNSEARVHTITVPTQNCCQSNDFCTSKILQSLFPPRLLFPSPKSFPSNSHFEVQLLSRGEHTKLTGFPQVFRKSSCWQAGGNPSTGPKLHHASQSLCVCPSDHTVSSQTLC